MHPSSIRYSIKVGRRFCGLIAAGSTRKSLHRRAGMPSASSVTRWLRDHPEFERLYRAACARRAQDCAKMGRRDPGLPGKVTTYTPERGAWICALVAEGWSLHEISRRPDGPGLSTIVNWQREHEEFRTGYLAAWEQHAQLVAEESVEIADEALGEGWAAPDGRPSVSAREALMHAKLRIDARIGRVNQLRPRGPAAKPAEEKRELTHEEWLDLLE
jgi:hypothetical protein